MCFNFTMNAVFIYVLVCVNQENESVDASNFEFLNTLRQCFEHFIDYLYVECPCTKRSKTQIKNKKTLKDVIVVSILKKSSGLTTEQKRKRKKGK